MKITKHYSILLTFLISLNASASGVFIIKITKNKIDLPSAPISTLVVKNGAIQWSDDSYSDSCYDYLNPTSSLKQYKGSTGDGIYRIETITGVVEEVNCDMTNGGWTQVFGPNMPQKILSLNSVNFSGNITNTATVIGLNSTVTCDNVRHAIGINNTGISQNKVWFKSTAWWPKKPSGYGGDACMSGQGGDGPQLNGVNLMSNYTTMAELPFSGVYSGDISTLTLGCSCVSGSDQWGYINQGSIWVK